MTNLDELLAAWSRLAEIRLEHLPGKNQFQVALPDRLPIELELIEKPPAVQFSCVLGPLPTHGCVKLMTDLLAANCRFAETDGATIGLDTEHDTVVLARRYDLDTLNPVRLGQAAREFTATCEHFGQRIAAWGLLPEDPFGQPPPAGMPV